MLSSGITLASYWILLLPSNSGYHAWYLLYYSLVSLPVSPVSLPVGLLSTPADPVSFPVSSPISPLTPFQLR